jgi:isoleucyl-tRNA synthetase
MSKERAGFAEVPPVVNVNNLETEVLQYWADQKIFEQSLTQREEGPLFTFYDGPPYATGKPHYGHILQSAIKDSVLRYKTMQGYYVPRRVGWDCHGLPVEVLVEKELGLKTKQDIEKLGIEKFNNTCRSVVFRYIEDFTSMLKRVGRWADYEGAYATLNLDYMESEWWVFKQLWEQELVYKDFRSTPYCVRCATPLSNHEVTQAYKDKTDETVYVRLSVDRHDTLDLLVWTTTPWTLPGNAAVAFNPSLPYVSVAQAGREIIVAKDRVEALFGPQAPITKEWTTAELEQLRYHPLYTFTPADATRIMGEISTAFRLVAADYVTAHDGTGLVHIAPAFGEEDAAVGKKYNLPVLRTIDPQGTFVEGSGSVTGKRVFEAADDITADLKKRGVLFKQESYTHSYPFCWRCDTPLIYYALDTWFIKVTALKDHLLKLNSQINWIPSHLKDGRFGKGLESAPDWAVSRNRFWSVPLPVWECEKCNERVCVGSVAELKQLAGNTDITDLHRPYVDAITWSCSNCAGKMKRTPEVLDVWFDAGSMPYAQWHYPFENKDLVAKGFPADFIAESIEQTRTWFYVLHVLAGILTRQDSGLGLNKPAFKNAIGSGVIFAEDGQKLSKKLKNYPEPGPIIEKYGADVVRLYLLSSASLGEPYRFSEKELKHLQRNAYLMLWNVYSFFTRYATVHTWTPSDTSQPSAELLDRWIVARVKQLQADVIQHSNAYAIDSATRCFAPFIDDLSNWYVRRSRSRFQKSVDEVSQEAAFSTLYYVLVELSKLIAPFMPFISEAMYRNLTGSMSVHLESLPQHIAVAVTSDEEKLLAAVQNARMIVSAGLALRAQAKLKVRQPLAQLAVQSEVALSDELRQMIADEVNVKEVISGKIPDSYVTIQPDPTLTVGLDTTLTPELQAEGWAREIIRRGQVLRKEAGYALNDRIVVWYVTTDPETQSLFERFSEEISTALQADQLLSSEGASNSKVEFVIDGKKVTLGVFKTE